MKKIISSLLIFFGLCFSLTVFAQERIDNFQTTIQINHNSSINVEEKIQYNFDNLERHGIYRDIPIKYKARGGNFSLKISDISVFDENNNPYQFTLSNQGNDKRIKIGDPNQLVSGAKTYVIRYKIDRAINYFKDHDELYWNATGNKWGTPINQASAKIILPESIADTELQIDCFFGILGSKEKCSLISRPENALEVTSIKEISFFQNNLSIKEGLTVVVGFPKGIVVKPSAIQKFSNILWDNKIIFLPILVFIIYFIIWWKKGRDPKGSGTIVAQYEAPDNLTPIEVGTLIDNKTDSRDISAEIIHLAINGYLKIIPVENKLLFFSTKDYILEQLKNPNDLENEFDRDLLNGLFRGSSTIESNNRTFKTIKLSKINKEHLYRDIKLVKKEIKETLIKKEYFVNDPNKIQGLFRGLGLIFIVGGIYWTASALGLGVISIISFILTGIISIIFGYIMPKMSKEGVLTKESILGLREYIRVAEADRIKFHNAPEKNPQLFEKLLPYAMVFKLENKWAEEFKDIYINPPDWYSSPTGSSFNSMLFVSGLNSFTSSANSAIISASSGAAGGGSGFGGGGFSGGGGGGGGGGSW